MKNVVLIILLSMLIFTGCQSSELISAKKNTQSNTIETGAKNYVIQENADNTIAVNISKEDNNNYPFNELEVAPSTDNEIESQQSEICEQVPIASTSKAQMTNGEFIFTNAHNQIDIDIDEKVFAAMFEEMMVNTERYLGETICIEGMYTLYSDDNGSDYNFVYRNGPECDCCGEPAFYGIEFTWGGDLPNENDWIQVVGVLDEYTQDGLFYLTLRGVSVTVLDERGKETVS